MKHFLVLLIFTLLGVSTLAQNIIIETFEKGNDDEITQNNELITKEKYSYMNSREFADFLYNYDYTLYERFVSGINIRGIGDSFLSSGLILTTFGIGSLLFVYENNNINGLSGTIGSLLCITGSALMVVSIPFKIIGISKINMVKSTFERRYFDNTSYNYTINLGLTSNGIGLIINF
jgi:hypothetical protein